jgi:parvulin-like peptidyl-prolyl isomerase
MSFIPALALLVAAQGPGSPANDIPAKYRTTPPAAGAVVARVNGVEIKAGDVEALLWEWRGFDAIQDLISYQVVKSEAQKQRIDVSEAEVEKAIDEGLSQMAKDLPAGKSIEAVLMEQGFTRSRLFLRYRTFALLDAMVRRSFNPKQLVKVSTMIFRPVNEQASSLSYAIQQADAAYKRLAKGDKWEDVLASVTKNPDLIRSKGLLGWKDLGAFPTSIRAELIKMKSGDFTKPAQTENGIQIFRLEKDGMAATLEEKKEMERIYVNSSRDPLLARLRKESRIERLYPSIPGLNSQKDGN